MADRILIVDDERALRVALSGLLRKEGYTVDAVGSGEEAVAALNRTAYQVVVTDLSLDGMGGMEVLEQAHRLDPDLGVIMITAYGSEKTAVEAMKRGAADYLPKPFDNDEIRVVVRRVLEGVRLKHEHRRLLATVQAHVAGRMIGRSDAMQRVLATVERVADADVTVLVRGPSGTGKELVAEALHYGSRRRGGPLIKMNCAALSRELVESELFGHEKGAFTGAVARHAGKFQAADGGTLFLDEIGDMPLETQAKLLRVIQEKEVDPVGGTAPVAVDVRLIAATNQSLEAAVREGRFREDLYYRLRVVEIAVPPLCERPDDIPLLVHHFLEEAAERFGRPPKPLSTAALRACVHAPWPGNVRELRAAVERAVLLAPGEQISEADLFEPAPAAHRPAPTACEPQTFKDAKDRVVTDFERRFLLAALDRHDWNVSQAASAIGMYRQNLQQKIRELGLERPERDTPGEAPGERRTS